MTPRDEKMIKRFRIIDAVGGEVLNSFDMQSEAIKFGKEKGGYPFVKLIDTEKVMFNS